MKFFTNFSSRQKTLFFRTAQGVLRHPNQARIFEGAVIFRAATSMHYKNDWHDPCFLSKATEDQFTQ
ncbi:hypothetical protein MXC99_09585 [Thauera aromatica]|uniref:hypothetical protein n=1 Tax=Thauera aromatica TaxID=59405 RepID=UPI001FFC34E4|nr:hypothetical protein [Thauera aromatica]MCK2088423.1 hypothetical protein [Thauera aromatica]MCK2127634.1 hypothetical protein [Thauera aromatica]